MKILIVVLAVISLTQAGLLDFITGLSRGNQRRYPQYYQRGSPGRVYRPKETTIQYVHESALGNGGFGGQSASYNKGPFQTVKIIHERAHSGIDNHLHDGNHFPGEQTIKIVSDGDHGYSGGSHSLGREQVIKVFKEHSDSFGQQGDYSGQQSHGHEHNPLGREEIIQVIKERPPTGGRGGHGSGHFGQSGGQEQIIKIINDHQGSSGSSASFSGGYSRPGGYSGTGGGQEQVIKVIKEHGNSFGSSSGHLGNQEQVIKVIKEHGRPNGGFSNSHHSNGPVQSFQIIQENEGSDNSINDYNTNGQEQIIKVIDDNGDFSSGSHSRPTALSAGDEQIIRIIEEQSGAHGTSTGLFESNRASGSASGSGYNYANPIGAESGFVPSVWKP